MVMLAAETDTVLYPSRSLMRKRAGVIALSASLIRLALSTLEEYLGL